ncbi:hypothetical protein NKR23_g8995 [Pleurostoma richardsiae]|uniref:Uncharacterized protein n=1 Tax=Pleurostoma richardsiae TaxID=41990 RepID=A0AA38R5B0_9PEZI|nr:hypothetical protein NKR23_g8995 [Pleurostoma richardsiae]
MPDGAATALELRKQWANPADVSTILLVIGGDVVQTAFARAPGKLYTPVCFCFGCVAYAFVSVVNVIGDADGDGIRISVYDAMPNEHSSAEFSWDIVHLIGLGITTVQLALAAGPIVLDNDWAIMLITLPGTTLVQITGLLPQWRAEKLPNRQRSSAAYALTSGNGSRDIVVILGRDNCLDLEELSASQSPRSGRPWEKFEWLSEPKLVPRARSGVPRRDMPPREARNAHGFPLGFWITRVICVVLSLAWLLLLVNVAAVRNHTWFLMGVGGIGMFQNSWPAATERPSKQRNLPLKPIDVIKTHKVMDGLMDFEVTYGRGRPLLAEFFPGKLRPDEINGGRATQSRTTR